MRAEEDALMTLAALHGVHTTYEDVDGVIRAADRDVVIELLRALDVTVDREQDAQTVLRDHRLAAARRRLEPVVVHRIGRQVPVTTTLPLEADPGDFWLTLELEDGAICQTRLAAAVTGQAAVEEVGSQSVRRVLLDLDTLGCGPIAAGYHRLTLDGAGPPESAQVIAAPDCPSGLRDWGVFIPLHALRSQADWGTGTYGDLARLGEWVGSLGGGLVGTLPLYPTFLEHPADPSPYMPVSRLAYNELFIDPTTLPEWVASAGSRSADGQGWWARVEALRASPTVEYEELARLKRGVLEPMARAVCSGDLPGRLGVLRDFGASHPELVDYARFRARLEIAGDDPELDPAVVGYHLYCQWAAYEQLTDASRAVSRYADLPVGSHPHGFDPVWAPESFVPRVHGGAPPDRFFARGQDWGFRPLHPEHMRDSGYLFLRAALRRAFRHADCLRIDHVMGLERMYMIPEGNAATDGAYVSYRADELYALVALEAARAGTVVVGEDLGTVPAGVRRRMAREHMLRSWVFQFESTPDRPLPEPPANALASLGTHDLPRFGAYLWGQDVTEREGDGSVTQAEADSARATRSRWRHRLLDELGIVSSESSEEEVTARALQGCLLHLAHSDAQLVLIDLEELWDERAPQNRPGTESERNWRQRSARTLDELVTDEAIAHTLSNIAVGRNA